MSYGVGTVVKLDYSVNSDSRNEYAVVLISDQWHSLRELLYDPQQFVLEWQRRYSGTPDMVFGNGPHKDWSLVGPFSIILEPLTVATPANIALLHGLRSMYPGVVAPLANVTTLTPLQFQDQIMAALQHPTPDAVTSNPFEFTILKEKTNCDTGKTTTEHLDPKETAEEFGCKPPQGPLAYIAEFAVLTRTVTIRYVPRRTSTQEWFKRLADYEGMPTADLKDFTGINLNHVAGTDLMLMHFDIAFRRRHDHTDVSARRADFVMSFLEDVGFFTKMKRETDVATFAMMKKDEKQYTLADPDTTNLNSGYIQDVKLPNGLLGPTVYIDSVYSPKALSEGKEQFGEKSHKDLPQLQSGGVPEPPAICIVGQTYQLPDGTWSVGGILVKAYMAPPPQGP